MSVLMLNGNIYKFKRENLEKMGFSMQNSCISASCRFYEKKNHSFDRIVSKYYYFNIFINFPDVLSNFSKFNWFLKKFSHLLDIYHS